MNYQHLFVSDWAIADEHTAEILPHSNNRLEFGHRWSGAGVFETGAPLKAAAPYPMATLDIPPTRSYRQVDQEQITVLLVEFRDEVYTRIATDLAEAGIRVQRAETADDALRLSAEMVPMIVVSNLDLPDQSGWLLAAKLKFIDPEILVWLYQPRSSSDDRGMAQFLHVDELLEYDGDLLGLSETIVGLMADRFFPWINAAPGECTAPEWAVA